jgi:membrane fusion protein (multidrug efflux system)
MRAAKVGHGILRSPGLVLPGIGWRGFSPRRAALALAVIAATAGAGTYAHSYWTTGRFLVSTDDAYVEVDFTTIAPKVSGYIVDVPITDNEAVHAGQVLARIDDRDYRTTLDQAKADVTSAQAGIGTIDAQLAEQQSTINEATAAMSADAAQLTFARQDYDRYKALASANIASSQQSQRSAAELQQSTAVLARDGAALAAARQQIGVWNTSRAKAVADMARLAAIEHQAELNLSYTTVVAPIAGTVGARSLRVGQYVQAGTALMAIVPLRQAYVVANYKETQLTDVRPGQPATIDIDTFPGKTIRGHVDSIAPASGLEFALLPPDNATGNFTKIVQRIPVKIALEPDDPLAGLLRAGMSVEPTIDTRPASSLGSTE